MIRNYHNYYFKLWSIMVNYGNSFLYYYFFFNQKLRFHWFVKRSLILFLQFFNSSILLTAYRFTIACKVKVIAVKVCIQL